MGSVGSDSGKEKLDTTPYTLLIAVLSVLLTFFIVMPVLGFMYMDMYHATNAAVHEVKKMKELRRQILIERTKE
jgi:flagellar biosynthesis protein FliP